MIENWKKDLVTEKSLRQVFVASKDLRKSKFNRIVYVITTVISFSVSVVFVYLEDAAQSADLVRSIAEICFNLTVQILGFLIGGFAIFATISDPKLMVKLAKSQMPNSNISVFKNIFFNFLSVFYVYVITLSTSVAIKIFSNIDTRRLYHTLSDIPNIYLAVINCLILMILSYLLTLSIVRLKSFIWNIYQAFLIFLIASDQDNPEES